MKWYTYLICFVLIAVGVFCSIELFRQVKAESYINGSIDIENQFSQESFNYSSSSVIFYNDLYDETNTYTFEKDLLKVNDFNGEDKVYKIILNDFTIINADVKAGSIFASVVMDFYNTVGEIVCNGELNISIMFLSDKTTLTLSTNGNEQSSFFEQFFEDNGIRLQVIEIL